MSDGHTGITDELDDIMNIASSDDEDIDDAVLEWDYSAEQSSPSSTLAYELMEYIRFNQ